MRLTLHIAKLLLLLSPLLTSTACTQEAAPEITNSKVKEGYQLYSKDGLSLKYASHWKIAYDDPQGLYSDRAVAFDATEYSTLTIYIYNEKGKSASDIADIFVRHLKLKTKEHIKNYVKSSTNVGHYNGIKLSWTNATLAPYSIEMSILPVGSPPYQVFAVFDLTEEDIERESVHMLPILESIQYNQ